MAKRITKRFIGIQDNDKNAYRKDTISSSVWERGSHPDQSGTHKL